MEFKVSLRITRATTRDSIVYNVHIIFHLCAPPASSDVFSPMVVPLDSVQVAYNPPSEYPDNEQDKSIDGLAPVHHTTHDRNRDHSSNLGI